MFQPVSLPLWLFVLILLFAAVTFASHFLFPSVRWFFRKRAERLVARLNTRLQRPIEPFKLARRHDMIQRLIYDPQVTEAIVDHARSNGVPENVAFEKARDYAREIVPSFSATAYFTFGMRAARWLSRSFYRIRLGTFDRTIVDTIDPDAAVVFVMNHRSNMDYVLVTYLVSRASAMSYAVGEWARIWPLSVMIRSMGAYFIRRKNRSALYRRVLARYVQMAVQGGVTQAFFPEGGLSLNGKVGQPKLGILNYIVSDFEPGARDVIFVPVAINYDRVLEDRFLIAADEAGVRKFRPPIGTMVMAVLRHLKLRVLRRFDGLGTASVSFGEPLSLSAFLEGEDTSPTEAVAAELMVRVRRVVPLVPVPLVSMALLAGHTSRSDVLAAVTENLAQMRSRGIKMPEREVAELVTSGVDNLVLRKILVEDGGSLHVTEGAAPKLSYYANSIAHHLDDEPALESGE